MRLLVALAFLYATVYYQFPTSSVVDLDDYFFASDVDEKSVKAPAPSNLTQVQSIASLPEVFSPDLPVSYLEIERPAHFSPFTQAVLKACRSPPV